MREQVRSAHELLKPQAGMCRLTQGGTTGLLKGLLELRDRVSSLDTIETIVKCASWCRADIYVTLEIMSQGPVSHDLGSGFYRCFTL